ncbi:MAG: GGDEF domain-containing protein [Deltaproteobacteria bacterium]|nr:GGDEF domain-containing protein [Deltaproteobacteria bacterium]
MEILHVPTLITANVILLVVTLTVSLVVLRWNPGVPGIPYWAIGNFLYILGFLFLSAKATPHPLLTIAFNTSIVAGFYAIYMGFQAHRGKAATGKTLILFPLFLILFAGTMIYLTYFEENEALRSSLVTMTIACLCFLIAFEIAGIPNSSRTLTSGFAILMTLHGIFNLIRSTVVLTIPDTRPFLEGGMMAKTTFSESFVMIFAFTIGYVLLILGHLLVRLRQQAEVDYLTNVFNRRAFIKLVEKARASAQRNDSALSLITIDLDRFKNVNDTYGHAAGDAALKHFSSVITDNLRPQDILGRLGGEEFMVLLPDTGRSDALDIAERLRLKIEQSVVKFEKARFKLTISLGISSAPRGEKTFDQLAKDSDVALYKAKRGGRNLVVVFQEKQ